MWASFGGQNLWVPSPPSPPSLLTHAPPSIPPPPITPPEANSAPWQPPLTPILLKYVC